MRSKKWIVAASAVTFAGPTMAQTSVTLYGLVDAFVGSTRAAGGDRAAVVGSGGMQTSYWGMRGSEDLGGTNKAIFDLNGFYRVDTGRSGRSDTDGFLTRNAYVGLQSSNYGTTRLGINATPYFVSTLLFNPLADSLTFAPSMFQTCRTATNGRIFDPGVIGDSRWANSVVYSTPVFGASLQTSSTALGSSQVATAKTSGEET